MNERECPYIVELQVPENGFGKTLDLMTGFHASQNIPSLRGIGRRMNDRDHARWCFLDLQHAKAFQALFGGELIESIRKQKSG